MILRRAQFVLFLLLAVCFYAKAQSPSPSIVLPQPLVAGEPATLAVLGPDGRLLSGVAVDFSGGKRVTTDATGRAAFRAPNDPGVMTTRLADGTATATATVLAPAEDVPEGVQIAHLSRVVMLNEAFSIRGSGFSGAADENRVLLGDKPALVLAASPIGLVVLPGADTPLGATQFVLEVGGRSPGPFPLRLVALDLVFDQQRFAAGEKGKFQVRVRGTEEPLDLEVRNLSPAVVRLIEGDIQRVRTRGGADNFVSLGLQGVRPGDYSISVKLVRPASGLPDTEAARQQLIAARRLAEPAWVPRLDKLISLLEQNPQNALQVRNELERMLAESPSGEFGRTLEAAWRTLLAR